MFLLEGEYSFIKIFPVWKDEVDIQIIIMEKLGEIKKGVK